MATFSSRLFIHDKICNTFFAEASTLSCNVRGSDDIFDDIGFGVKGLGMVSHKTGAIAFFKLDKTILNADNDIVEWVLVPTYLTMSLLPGLTNARIMIAND